MGGEFEKVRIQTVITYLCLGFDSWTMAIAWQEHDQDICERLGVAGRAEVGRLTATLPALGSFGFLCTCARSYQWFSRPCQFCVYNYC
jgi:hypothetical protein